MILRLYAQRFFTEQHAFCSNLVAQSAHVTTLQKMARHVNIQTTMGYYVHIPQDTLRWAIDAQPDLLTEAAEAKIA